MSRLARVLFIALLMTPGTVVRAETGSGEDIADDIVRKVDPAVVAIQHEAAGGSGFIISPDGYILSNGHVVRGNDEEDPTLPARSITVILNNEEKYPARVIGFSMDPDVSLLKIEPGRPLPVVEIGDSRHVQVGQRCFAVGMPLGLKRTFTRGILSNVERTDLGTEVKVFQTDAAINPGNSGGPLFDSNGRVLGLNTYAQRGANNLGFTIPIHVAMVLKEHFLKHGRFVRADVPVFSVGELYAELAAALGVDQGILIEGVLPGSSAERAGLRPGDILVEVDGRPVSARTHAELLDVQWELTIREPGTPIAFTVLRGPRGSREKITIRATLEKVELMPRWGLHAGEIVEHRYEALGLGVRHYDTLSRLINTLPPAAGVLVARASAVEAAGKAGLRVNDILTHVAGRPTPDVVSFQRELEAQLATRTNTIELTVVRGRAAFPTALAPVYALRKTRIALVAPPRDAEYIDLLRRELLASGASLTVGNPADLKASDHDVVLLAGGAGARAWWDNGAAQKLVQEAAAAKKVTAAIGPSAVVLARGLPGAQGRKMTTSKDDSAELLKAGVNYTGKEVETDGLIVTGTGFDRPAVREFLKALYRVSGNAALDG